MPATTGDPGTDRPRVDVVRARGEVATLRLAGSWRAIDHPPDSAAVEEQLQTVPRTNKLTYDCTELVRWDSGLLTFLQKIESKAAADQIAVDRDGLPAGVQRLLNLAAAVPERKGARRGQKSDPVLTRVGKQTQSAMKQSGALVEFIGEATSGFGRAATAQAKFRRSDLLLLMQECGVQALPIVSLISVLVGLILAFVGSVQLRQFGAQIFVADLVGIAMAREMGALMTAIIMAGRTGAAFAAQLGTMEVNEEIDALKTFGFPPIDFLVTPRMLALIAMMPVLTLYADLLGIVGGGIVGVAMLDIPLAQYINETQAHLGVSDFAVGLVKSVVFGVLIAIAGCSRGMRCGRSASAVGAAATSAVVMAIVMIVVADGIFAVLTDRLGI